MSALLRSVIIGCCALVALAANAQIYPTKPIRIIVPFVAGGPTDVQARWAGQQLNTVLGQPVIVDNRGGAGGVPGTEAVVKSAPDGYTLLAGNPGPLTIAPSVRVQLPYDTLRDLSRNKVSRTSRVSTGTECWRPTVDRKSPSRTRSDGC